MAGSVHTEGLSKRLYDAQANHYPDHRDDRRPVHAVGIGAVGYFEPSMVASDYTIAEHFQGGRIPVTVKFLERAPASPPEADNPESGAAGVLAYANRHLSVRPGTVAALLLSLPGTIVPVIGTMGPFGAFPQ